MLIELENVCAIRRECIGSAFYKLMRSCSFGRAGTRNSAVGQCAGGRVGNEWIIVCLSGGVAMSVVGGLLLGELEVPLLKAGY